jgi:glutamine amidotransferase
MCELFAMSSSQPASVTYSVREFARHGGLTADNTDGWGIAYLVDGDARLFRDTDAAAESSYLRFVAEREFRSEIVFSHIRRATQGEVALRNTQPFRRELGGRIHLFCHNGDLHGVGQQAALRLGRHQPIGETDSEHAFCALLRRLSHLWSDARSIPGLAERLRVVEDFARDIRPLGPANFVYTDGDAVFLHGHKRKDPRDGVIRPPGLHLLCRSCKVGASKIQTPGLTVATATQHVVLAASAPLTDEPWQALAEGEIVVVQRGQMVPLQAPEAAGTPAPRS